MSGIEFLPLIAIALLFWLLVIRPQSRRAKELRALQSSLEVGDLVMLTSGIHGTVRRLDDEHAYVDVASPADLGAGAGAGAGGVVVKVVRAAIGLKIEPTSPLAQDQHEQPLDRQHDTDGQGL